MSDTCHVCGAQCLLGPGITPGSVKSIRCPHLDEDWHKHAAANVERQSKTLYIQHTGVEPEPEPTASDLASLDLSGVESASDDLRRERRQKFLSLFTEKLLPEMFGGSGSLTPDQIQTLKEGYADMLSGLLSTSGPSLPPGAVFVPPSAPPPSVFTIEEDGRLVSIDFFCLLSRTIMQEIDLSSGEALLTLTNGEIINLSPAQTKGLIRYISALSAPGSGFFVRKADGDLLSHPFVQSVLAEVDAEFTGDGGAKEKSDDLDGYPDYPDPRHA